MHTVFLPGVHASRNAPKQWITGIARAQTEGRPYAFKDAETLLDDFCNEVERVLTEHGIPFEIVEVTEGDNP